MAGHLGGVGQQQFPFQGGSQQSVLGSRGGRGATPSPQRHSGGKRTVLTCSSGATTSPVTYRKRLCGIFPLSPLSLRSTWISQKQRSQIHGPKPAT